MKKIILIVLFFLLIVNTVNAIPIPALVIGYDFILLLIPAIFSVFSIIFLYFRKYLFFINLFFCLVFSFLYFIHLYFTHEIFIISYEYVFFIVIFILIGFSYRFKYLGYFIILPILFFIFFLLKIDYNLYQFKNIQMKIKKELPLNIEIIKTVYKDNFIAIYGYDIKLKDSAGIIIENNISDYLSSKKVGRFFISDVGDKKLGKILLDIAYRIIE